MPELPSSSPKDASIVTRLSLALLLAVMLAALTACGATTTSDTEGMTLADARAVLTDEGVAAADIAVAGETGAAPAATTVCDHDPDGVDVASPTTLYVAQDCDDAYAEGGALAAFVAAGKIKPHAVKQVTRAAARKVRDRAVSSTTSGSTSTKKKSRRK